MGERSEDWIGGFQVARRAREEWREEAKVRPKLEVMGRLMDRRCEARCVAVDCKRQRRMLMKLRGGTAELRIETGRWCELLRDTRIHKMCDEREVEDVEHFLLYCNGMAEERKEMVRVMNEIMEGWQEMDGKDKMVYVVDKACENGQV